MTRIKSVEYFRVPPRWLLVKIIDEDGSVGWGEASLEGHTQAVEGCLDAYTARIVGMEAEHVLPTTLSASVLTGCSDIEHIWQLLYRFGFYRGGPVMMSAMSGIDIALWDLKGTATTFVLLWSFLTPHVQLANSTYQSTSFLVVKSGIRSKYTHGLEATAPQILNPQRNPPPIPPCTSH
jgi:L-alanine-DL-glutamate epimerase-like enolase superfamily enzyme